MDQAEGLRAAFSQKNKATPAEEKNARVITITSGKGGVGKSNMSVNLAVEFTKMGKKVIIFDADLGLANVEVMFGAIPKHNLSDVIYRGMSIKDVITEGPMGIGFISGGSGIVGLNNLNADQINFLVHNLTELGKMCDILIVDTGAGVSDSVLSFVLSSPEIILVSTPEPSSLTDSYSLMKALYKNEGFVKKNAVVHVVANKVTSYAEGQLVYEKLQTVVSQFLGGSLAYLGMIPQDVTLEKAVRLQQLVTIDYPTSKSAKAFNLIAGNLERKEEAVMDKKMSLGQIFGGFFRKGK
ncbi:MAG: MinD/ParA family protein [Lachnospiraceae bacterium]|nr:MinD/ParA family protein [Lachnospiraceae bacterium]